MKRCYSKIQIPFLSLLVASSLWMPVNGFAQETSPFYNPNKPTKSADDVQNGNESSFQVTIDPRHRTALSAEVASPVKKINKKMGETFKQGELLLKLNDILFLSNMQKAESALEKAQVELDAKKQLFHDNVASLFELKEGEANVATAKADLALARRNLEATSILAPYDGKVIAVDIEEFETPQLGKNLIEVVDDNVLIARFLVPSSYLPKLSVGMPFQILLKETGEKIPVKISRIGSVIDPSSGTVKIEADIENSSNKLRTGMTGRAIFNFNGQNS